MSSFNHNLDLFLISCRETAYAELQENKEYAEFKSKQNGLRSELEAVISDEAKKILASYLEATSDILGIEANNIMLCGLTLTSEMQKRFDRATPEYAAFVEEFL